MRRRPRKPHADAGASLILTIGFVLMIGAISAGMAGLATSSLNNRTSLELVRNREYAADGAIEQALSNVRSQVVSPLAACATVNGSSVDTLNAIAIRVDWRAACGVVQSSDGTVVAQHNVIFSACQNTGSACLDAAVIIRAEVNFERSSTGVVTKTYVQSWSVNR